MRAITLCLILIALPRAVSAATIVVGETEIEIPNPSSFSEVTPDMATLYEVQKQFVAHTNVEFLAFISDKDVPTALKNEIPELERRFTVQTAKSLVNLSVTKNSFEELKQVIKTQNVRCVVYCHKLKLYPGDRPTGKSPGPFLRVARCSHPF